MKKPFSALIVDDEPPARQYLCELLAKHREIEIVAQAGGVPEAARLRKVPSLEIRGPLRCAKPHPEPIPFAPA